MRRGRKVLFATVSTVLFLLLFEVGLRIQQAVGPVVDLEFDWLDMQAGTYSDRLNHVPPLERSHAVVLEGETWSWTSRYDEKGLRINSLRPTPVQPGVKVLFMGDSFVEGYDDEHTIPQVSWRKLQTFGAFRDRLVFLNAGCSSYSPLIHVVQVRELLPLVKPDVVWLEIDETDLMDDWIRYRQLVIRDDGGHVVAVRGGRTPFEEAWFGGLESIQNEPVYAVRLFKKIYLTRVEIPNLPPPDATYQSLFGPQLAGEDEVHDLYAEQIAFYRDNLTAVVALLKEALGPENVIVSYHPHYMTLEENAEGRRYNDVLSRTVREVCQANGVICHDGTELVRDWIATHPGRRVFRFPEDPFSHFTKEGMRLYGELVADALAVPIRRRLESR